MMKRRVFLLVGAGAGIAALAALRPSGSYGQTMDASQAYSAVAAGTLTLVDIRRPYEWALTGVARGAHPLDMQSADFEAELVALVKGNAAAPIALICARGVRSARLAQRLTRAGFTGIVDVPEGMLGSRAGPGWIARGLPVTPG